MHYIYDENISGITSYFQSVEIDFHHLESLICDCSFEI